MKQKITIIVLASLLMFISASNSFAQEQPQWKVGDKIEVKNLSGDWVAAKVIKIEDWRESGRGFAYRVEVEDPNAPNRYWAAPANTVRALPNQQNDRQTDNQPVGGNPETTNGGAFAVGDRVDTFYDEQRGHNRGTIIEVGSGKYKVHYNGCTQTFDEWIDRMLVRPAATIAADAPEIKFLIGRWSLTAVAVGNNNVFWGKSPGIQINADGTYIWYQDGGKPPVKGKWRTDAKVPGIVEGTPKFDGIVVKNAEGLESKAFRWVVKNDNQERIEIDQMCSNHSEIGSRAR